MKIPEANTEAEMLHIALQGNEAAIAFCSVLFRVSQVLDDLIDKDKPVSDEAIRDAFWDCLVQIPSNSFYQQNFPHLQPMIRSMFLDWEDATDLEKGNDSDRNLAFVLRDSIGMMVIHCALMIGGRKWARGISLMVRRYIHDEPLNLYKEALP